MLRRRYMPKPSAESGTPGDASGDTLPEGCTGKAYPPKKNGCSSPARRHADRSEAAWLFVPDVHPTRGARHAGVGYYVAADELSEIGRQNSEEASQWSPGKGASR